MEHRQRVAESFSFDAEGDKMQKRIFFILSTAITFILLFGVLTGAQADISFEGKVITFVAPSSAGGGTDVLARMVARHIKNYLPGKPSVVIRNMAGAQGLIGAHYVYHQQRKDGRIVLVSTGTNTNGNDWSWGP